MKTTSERGRPCLLTPEVQHTICSAIASGGYIATAAAVAGISERTLYGWMRRGADETEGQFVDFLHAIKKALAVAEFRYVQVIGKASETQWQAAAWMLERRFAKNWAKDPPRTIPT